MTFYERKDETPSRQDLQTITTVLNRFMLGKGSCPIEMALVSLLWSFHTDPNNTYVLQSTWHLHSPYHTHTTHTRTRIHVRTHVYTHNCEIVLSSALHSSLRHPPHTPNNQEYCLRDREPTSQPSEEAASPVFPVRQTASPAFHIL